MHRKALSPHHLATSHMAARVLTVSYLITMDRSMTLDKLQHETGLGLTALHDNIHNDVPTLDPTRPDTATEKDKSGNLLSRFVKGERSCYYCHTPKKEERVDATETPGMQRPKRFWTVSSAGKQSWASTGILLMDCLTINGDRYFKTLIGHTDTVQQQHNTLGR